MPFQVDEATNKSQMLRGELYHAFTPALTAARARCQHACKRFSNAGEIPRRRLVEMWRDIIDDKTPLPPPAPTAEEDDELFQDEPWVEGPIHIDYGTNVKLGANVFVNFNCTILDTCPVSIGARTLIGPNVSLYAGTHPLDPLIRNGTKGPELGGRISIGEDCWIGGNVTVLPGVAIGRGSTVGAGSVVTKDIPPFHVAAGNPARVLRRIDTMMDPQQASAAAAIESTASDASEQATLVETSPAVGARPVVQSAGSQVHGAELEMKEQAEKDEILDPADEEKLWRAFAANEKAAAEAGVYPQNRGL